jgi:hypothetical protein
MGLRDSGRRPAAPLLLLRSAQEEKADRAHAGKGIGKKSAKKVKEGALDTADKEGKKIGRLLKLTGGGEAKRNPRPMERLVGRLTPPISCCLKSQTD